MKVFENNIKMNELKNGKLLCKCGSIRYNIDIVQDDNDEYNWIVVTCRNCGNILFYNGA